MAQSTVPATQANLRERPDLSVRARAATVNLFFYVVMAALAIVFLAPLLWMITASLKPENEVLVIPPTFIPRDFQYENYVEVWGVIPRFLYNSVKLAGLTVGGVLIVTSMAGYAFARL
jgi:multiple sugar transport system permease protein/sn-glycerol 3-phosphate transport system permease protein